MVRSRAHVGRMTCKRKGKACLTFDVEGVMTMWKLGTRLWKEPGLDITGYSGIQRQTWPYARATESDLLFECDSAMAGRYKDKNKPKAGVDGVLTLRDGVGEHLSSGRLASSQHAPRSCKTACSWSLGDSCIYIHTYIHTHTRASPWAAQPLDEEQG